MNKRSLLSRPEGSRATQFWVAFWLTIFVLLGLYLFAQHQLHQQLNQTATEPVFTTDPDGKTVFSASTYERLQEQIPALKKFNADQLQKVAAIDIADLVDKKVDELFAPVYLQVPKFASFHYSVPGEYSELASYLAGEIGKNMQRVLYDETDFERRLSETNEQISAAATKVLAQALSNIQTQMQQTIELKDEDMNILRQTMLLAMEDVEARYQDGLLAVRGVGAAAGLGLSVAGLKLASKAIAKKVAAKAAAKGALKVGGIAAGAGSGAAAGSVLGPVGTVIGGIVGATVAWVATDAVIIEIDEYFNRDEFEAELITMIDTQKTQLKDSITESYASLLQSLAEQNEKAFDALTPADLIRGTGK